MLGNNSWGGGKVAESLFLYISISSTRQRWPSLVAQQRRWEERGRCCSELSQESAESLMGKAATRQQGGQMV